jgi:hypothetical protein
MADIFDMLISILCPTSQSAQSCQQFLSNHQEFGVVGQAAYFILFPIIFIMIFIWELSGFVFKDKKKYNLLISIAFLIFIIMQGWYSLALVLSEFWFIVIIILGGFALFMHKFTGGKSSGGGASSAFINEIKNRAAAKLGKQATKSMGLRSDAEKFLDKIDDKLEKNNYNLNCLTEQEKEILSMRLGIPASAIESKKLRDLLQKQRG